MGLRLYFFKAADVFTTVTANCDAIFHTNPTPLFGTDIFIKRQRVLAICSRFLAFSIFGVVTDKNDDLCVEGRGVKWLL